ncbi:MAG: glycosyltransferase family 2 protein [Bacteroidales bacterium]|nr:glycosyltransferase family 2 protein [Bacteroidales bacterium]
MSSPILSIIVPVYKTEQYLDSCVKSIVAQTLQDWEMILVDDGSPDNCPMMCDQYAANESRIKVIHQENGGLSRARNQGILLARGKYIAFVDSDDDIESDTYKGNINFMEEHPDVDVVQFPARRIGWGDQFYHEPNKYYRGRKELILNNYKDSPIDNTVCMKIFRRELFDTILFREGHVHEDKTFILEMLKHINCLYISDIGCYNYYRRENSIQTTDSYNKTSDWIDTEVTTLKNLYEFPELKSEWIGRWMYNVRWLMNLQYKHPDWDVLPLLKYLRSVTPQFNFNAKAKDMFWYCYIRTLGVKQFHRHYLHLLQLHKES